MHNRKAEIESRLNAMREENFKYIAALTDRVSLEDYRPLVRLSDGKPVWTDALQAALTEHEIVVIPASPTPYYIDASVRMPSNRRIEAADGAIIRLLDGVTTLMLRNEHTMNGTHRPIPEEGCNFNLSIDGGRWEEYHTSRAGYGRSGKYDEAHTFFGVSTCLLFNHLQRLTLTNMTFAHTAGFAVQVGNLQNAVFENITFDSCYADGLHINGRTENVLVRNISGSTGDDLVALNMYDWQNSSVTFGPGRTILCENLDSTAGSGYKSLRIEPGVYTYDDASEVDCSLSDAIIRGVRGVLTYKIYFQTPAYDLSEEPERGRAGTVGSLFFEDIDVDLSAPVDSFAEYLESDPVRGAFGAFEIGANVECLSLENVRLTLHRDRFPLSQLVVVGPKSCRLGSREVFDPYVCNRVREIVLKDITINGQPMDDAARYICATAFDDVNGDGRSTGAGTIDRITVL